MTSSSPAGTSATSGLVLKPGDILLYRTNSLVGWIIRTKTWSPVNHSETYLGSNYSAASRDGIGVDTYTTYPLDDGKRKLEFVCRPNVPFDFKKGKEWHEKQRGQEYDLLGLLVSFFSQKGGARTKMFCSEHTARMAREEGLALFGSVWDADKVSPGMFLASPLLTVYRPDGTLVA